MPAAGKKRDRSPPAASAGVGGAERSKAATRPRVSEPLSPVLRSTKKNIAAQKSASASDGGATRSKAAAKPRVPEPLSPDLRSKKNIKAHSEKVKADTDARLQAAIAKSQKKVDARDEIIRSAKRALLTARRLRNGGKAKHGDVQQFADDYKIKREELRTALKQPGLTQVRATAGRPPKVTEAQAHFLVKEVESRVRESRAKTRPAVASALGAISHSNADPFQTTRGAAVPRRTIDRFCKHRGLTRATANETDKARLIGVSKKHISGYFQRYKDKIQDPNLPHVLERRRHGNLDETPQSGRGEKLNRRLYALVTKKALKRLKGGAVRTEAIEDGYEGVSFVPFLLGDGTMLAKIFIVSAEKVNPKWTAPPPQGLATSHEFLCD
jgi:hypothetical protein